MPPGRVRSAAAWSSSSCSAGNGVARHRRSGRRARTPRPGARRIDERTVEAVLVELPDIGVDDTDVRHSQPPDVLLELAGTAEMELDRGHVAAEHRGLGAGSGAGVENSLAVA